METLLVLFLSGDIILYREDMRADFVFLPPAPDIPAGNGVRRFFVVIFIPK